MAKGKFVIVGRAGMDLYPKPANKQTSEAGTFISDLGGSAANIAVSISKLGGRSQIITVVSDDEIGDFVWKKLEEHKVDTSLVTKSQNNNARTSLDNSRDKRRDQRSLSIVIMPLIFDRINKYD